MTTITRRGFVGGSLAAGIAATGCVPPEQGPAGRFVGALRIIEAEAGGTLGAEILNTDSGLSVGLNRERRFGMCSSFKLSLAAKVLAEDAAGNLDADRMVRWGSDDLVTYSPFTQPRVGEGASLRELARAAQVLSDNTAANLLLRAVGGPPALTGFWRSIGDEVSRLDRYEPALNNVPVTEYRDTTTPQAMARTVARLVYGNALPAQERETLRQWMIETRTGAGRVRAGLPPDDPEKPERNWIAGDKTGTSLWPGMGGLYVDVGFVEPPETPPIAFATFYRAARYSDSIDPAAERALARVGELIATYGERGDWFPF